MGDEEILLEDLFEVVFQPEYSRDMLLSLEAKYDMYTLDFVRLYNEEMPLIVPGRDASYWIYHWEQFIASEGNIDELTSHFFNADDDYGSERTKDDLAHFLDDPSLIGQPLDISEETITVSSFLAHYL
jgi:hypothetical protein